MARPRSAEVVNEGDAVGDATDNTVSPGPQENTERLSAKQRIEKRAEDKKDKLHEEYDEIRKLYDFSSNNYKATLYRINPEFFTDPATGRTFTTGKADGLGGMVQMYTELPEIDEIQRQHGGQDYRIVIVGPDPDNPGKNRSKSYKLPRILADPKTVGTPHGAMTFEQAPWRAQQQQQDSSVISSVMTLVKDAMDRSEKNTERMLDRMKPAIDPSASERAAAEREERRQAHEQAMKKMELDAQARRDEIDRAEKKADAQRKELAEERQRQHEKELAAFKAAEDARREEAKQRAEDQKANLKMMMDFQQANRDALERSDKNFREALEKVTEKLASNKQDPMETMMNSIDFIDKIRGGRDEGGPVANAISQTVPKLADTLDRALVRWTTSEKPKKEKPKPRAEDETMAAVELDDDPVPENAKPVNGESSPPFAWPTEASTFDEISVMLFQNLEAALRSDWDATRIFTDMLLKFPTSFLDTVLGTGMNTIMTVIDTKVPDDAKLKTPRGKNVVKNLFRALAKRKNDATKVPASPQ